MDSSGTLYIADTGNNRIRRVAGGTITTVAGNGIQGFSGDGGQATNASLDFPTGLVVDSGNSLYIADSGNNRIRKISGGMIATVAGNGTFGFTGDGGPATNASLGGPMGLAADSSGNLYVLDYGGVRKVSGGTITTVASFNQSADFANFPNGLAADSAGNLYIADDFDNRIREVSVAGTLTTVAGNGTVGFSGDGGPATSAQLNFPSGVAVDSAGNLYIADQDNKRIRRVSAGGTITTVAGNGGFSGDGGPATSASLDSPYSVALDSVGNLYIADSLNHRIRKVSAGGTITTVAGSGIPGFSGDGGPAASAALYKPYGIVLDAGGNLYIADTANDRIRKVSGGTITTVAGNGGSGPLGDGGQATNSFLVPNDVVLDSAGNLYIADVIHSRIRKVSNGTITTVAGNGAFGFSGDGGAATSASLYLPNGMAVGTNGNLYIADSLNNRIRRVSQGLITTIAGNGTAGFSGDGGPAVSASLQNPWGVSLDTSGNLYIADCGNNRIRKVSGGTITTVAGTGAAGFGGDGGPAASASLSCPIRVALDAAGNLYIADTGNNRIREVFAGAVSYQAMPASLSFSATAGGNAAGTQTINLSCAVAGLSFTASTSAAWLSASPSTGSLPSVLSVSTDPTNLAAGKYQGTVP